MLKAVGFWDRAAGKANAGLAAAMASSCPGGLLCRLSLEFWAVQNAVNHVSKSSYVADKHGFYQYDFSL